MTGKPDVWLVVTRGSVRQCAADQGTGQSIMHDGGAVGTRSAGV